MKRISVFFFLLLGCSVVNAQNVAGNWQGIMTQPGGLFATSFAFFLNLEQEGDSIYGFSRLEVANTTTFGVFDIHGQVKEGKVLLQETKISDAVISIAGAKWCIKYLELDLNKTEDYLEGNWSAPNGCGPGGISVYKSTLDFNALTPESYDQGSLSDIVSEIEGESEKHVKVGLYKVNFASNSTVLDAQSMAALDEIVALMNEHSSIKIKITGHTDSDGSDVSNFTLSTQRAKSAANYLIEKGISSKRLAYEGYGESRPKEDNKTEEGKLANRRIEIELIKK